MLLFLILEEHNLVGWRHYGVKPTIGVYKMTPKFFPLFLLVVSSLLFSACLPIVTTPSDAATLPATVVSTPTEQPITPEPLPTEKPSSKVPALPMESVTYENAEINLLMDLPATWTIGESMVIGDRATQTLMSSPDNSTTVNLLVNLWEPHNDLAAYVEVRQTAWEASGFTVLSSEEWILDNGQPVRVFIVETAEQNRVFFLLTPLDDRYLTLAGEGDLVLVEQIALTLRFVSQ